ncbi:hypothetical protein DAPPUDRAFT_335955 [Daphnia pulex]|uniref:Uncharacterized protein n=1 Tax=Daphnia pulex TaxID=6669 RepID=E9HYU0_DAPPU|nr:hypothetical protein DAPPUDRAFT_335955 [Daphnia pulex]|eukprot:EFX63090.1 hypothetical protein DAPPUDRAFT_335955 [Daphnia pulex]
MSNEFLFCFRNHVVHHVVLVQKLNNILYMKCSERHHFIYWNFSHWPSNLALAKIIQVYIYQSIDVAVQSVLQPVGGTFFFCIKLKLLLSLGAGVAY